MLSWPCTLQAFVAGLSAPSHPEAQIWSGVNKALRRGNDAVRMHGPDRGVPAFGGDAVKRGLSEVTSRPSKVALCSLSPLRSHVEGIQNNGPIRH